MKKTSQQRSRMKISVLRFLYKNGLSDLIVRSLSLFHVFSFFPFGEKLCGKQRFLFSLCFASCQNLLTRYFQKNDRVIRHFMAETQKQFYILSGQNLQNFQELQRKSGLLINVLNANYKDERT